MTTAGNVSVLLIAAWMLAGVSVSAQQSSQAQSSVDEGARLDLVCQGSGVANKAVVMNKFSSGNAKGTIGGSSVQMSGTSQSTMVGHRAQEFGDQVSLNIEGSEGRLRMPRTMLPKIHGGEDGWFKLKDIRISQEEITASVAVSALNNPKLRVDRYTGAISISGKSGDFTGSCSRFDPQQQQRQF